MAREAGRRWLLSAGIDHLEYDLEIAAVDSTSAEALVIDLRWNNIGNSGPLPPLIQRIIERPRLNQRGKLSAITGPYTFLRGDERGDDARAPRT